MALESSRSDDTTDSVNKALEWLNKNIQNLYHGEKGEGKQTDKK